MTSRGPMTPLAKTGRTVCRNHGRQGSQLWAAKSVDGRWSYQRLEDVGTPWIVLDADGADWAWFGTLASARRATARHDAKETSAMTTPKLTGPQRALLDAVAAGQVHRDDSGTFRPLYQTYRADTGRAVPAAALDRLFALGLVLFAPPAVEDRRQRQIVLTVAGRALVAQDVTA